jgi:hypothetical protein
LGPRTITIALGLTALGLCSAAACSLENQLGPDVSCASLGCGQVNACADGIIAQCADGVTIRYHVCAADDDEICEQDWQVPGQYRCDEYGTDCEGCDPSGPGCPTASGGSGAGGAPADGG